MEDTGNAGIYTLLSKAVTTALSAEAQTAVKGLKGAAALSLLAEMIGGSGGTSIAVLVQTTFDGGTTWLDIARFEWTTTASKKWCVVQGLSAKALATYAALAAEGVNDGLLGDDFRAVITTTGTYTNTTVAVRMAAR